MYFFTTQGSMSNIRKEPFYFIEKVYLEFYAQYYLDDARYAKILTKTGNLFNKTGNIGF